MFLDKNKKVFLIINSYYIGDVLLVNPLIQNIKKIYKDAFVVMVVPPTTVSAAKYQYGVDDIVVWDRKGILRGLYNTLKFVLNFPYKNIYASFPIYSSDRAITLSFLLRSKYILGKARNIIGLLLKSKYKIKNFTDSEPPKDNVNLLSGITKEELHHYPIKLSLPDIMESKIINNIKALNNGFITLCPTSSNIEKDMPKEDVCKIIETCGHNVILLGKGKTANQLSEFLNEKNYENLTDLTDKTSYTELAKIIELSEGCISVDTGTLHLACGLNKPTVCIYYTEKYNGYKPDTNIYTKLFCGHNLKTEEIVNNLNNLMQKETVS